MAKLDVPFLVAVQRNGRTWYYWQPSSPLRREGWKPQRLADELPKAIAEAQAVNAELETRRAAREAKKQRDLMAKARVADRQKRKERRKIQKTRKQG